MVITAIRGLLVVKWCSCQSRGELCQAVLLAIADRCANLTLLTESWVELAATCSDVDVTHCIRSDQAISWAGCLRGPSAS